MVCLWRAEAGRSRKLVYLLALKHVRTRVPHYHFYQHRHTNGVERNIDPNVGEEEEPNLMKIQNQMPEFKL